MSRRGDCWDNAVAESFFSTLKQELDTCRWSTRASAETAVRAYIEDLYNPVRLHSTLGYEAPAVFEAAGVSVMPCPRKRIKARTFCLRYSVSPC